VAQDTLSTPPPIVHTPRVDLRDAVREELKGLGVGNALVPSNRDDCIEKLVKNPESVLVLDWELGAEDVNVILSSVKGHFLVETRPVFLVTPDISDGIIAVAAEYGVSQVHAGPISRLTITECLEAIFKEDNETKVVRDTLVQVANARHKGDWSLATPILIELHDKLPEHERVATELAENLIYENAWQQALKVLEPFANQDPPSVRAMHLKGRCLMQAGDYDKAVAILEKAKLINPHNVDRLIDLGNAFLRVDRIDEAMENFDAATSIEPTRKDAQVGKGQCLLMAGEVNEALGLLKAISGPRELASIFNTAAVLSMRNGHHEKGMSLYKSAMAAIGKNDKIQARLYFNMGLGYKRWNKPEKAAACFAKSLELDPSYEKAARHNKGAAPIAKPRDAFPEEEFTKIQPADAAKRPLGEQAFSDVTEGFDVEDVEDRAA